MWVSNCCRNWQAAPVLIVACRHERVCVSHGWTGGWARSWQRQIKLLYINTVQRLIPYLQTSVDNYSINEHVWISISEVIISHHGNYWRDWTSATITRFHRAFDRQFKETWTFKNNSRECAKSHRLFEISLGNLPKKSQSLARLCRRTKKIILFPRWFLLACEKAFINAYGELLDTLDEFNHNNN